MRPGPHPQSSTRPPWIRLHVGAVEDAANYWKQGLNSSLRVREIFGDDPGGLVLDWGCGPGRTMHWLVRQGTWGANYRGCDLDLEALAWLAKAKVRAVSACGALPPLPYPDQHFSGLFAFSVLTHIHPEHHRAWYEEIRRVLKPGGRAYVTLHGDAHQAVREPLSGQALRDYLAKGWRFSPHQGHCKSAATATEAFTREALKGLLEVSWYHSGGYGYMDDMLLVRAG